MDLTLQLKPQNKNQLKLRLMALPKMQQALHVLQLPTLDLKELIEEELVSNPLLEEIEPQQEEELEEPEEISQEIPLEFDEHDFSLLNTMKDEMKDLLLYDEKEKRSLHDEEIHSFLDSLITAKHTLSEYLLEQAEEAFEDPLEKEVATVVIGSLDPDGLLRSSLEEIATLTKAPLLKVKEVIHSIQTFDPLGIAASNLQECLLIQLRSREGTSSIAYQLIQDHFEALLKHQFKEICTKLKISLEKLEEIIDNKISCLNFHPANRFSQEVPISVIPDLKIIDQDNILIVSINEETLPTIRLCPKYLKLIETKESDFEAFGEYKEKLHTAKWFLKSIEQRSSLLRKLGEFLIVKQHQFFKDPQAPLVPLEMREVAKELNVHESTITRAVANKVLECSRGCLPLRDFFNYTYETTHGEAISSQAVKEQLRLLIEQEDKLKPYSDEQLSKLFSEKGIPCARRTIAKYRKLLGIETALLRKTSIK